ncbi:hypothetical protein [Amycolatopsis sp. NPDC052450]|uniref:hypothetical protein n=1 Tax=Amycolatopsis sp. NPDC052450 TaxID=3363937 RepID=UPI0037C6BBF4
MDCAVVERSADVGFEAVQLSDQGGLVDAKVIGGVNGDEGHDGAEVVETLPAMSPSSAGRWMSQCRVTGVS